MKNLEIDSERWRMSLSVKRVKDQLLPRRELGPDDITTDDGATAGDLDDVPELGLSEDVFAGGAAAGAPSGEAAEAEQGDESGASDGSGEVADRPSADELDVVPADPAGTSAEQGTDEPA